MKKTLILGIVFFFLSISTACAFNGVNANQVTMAGDATTSVQTSNGTQPLPEGDYIKYEVFLSTQEDHSDGISLGTTLNTEFTYTFTDEGKFYGGVRSIRFNSADEMLNESIIAGSNQQEYVQTDTFGFKYFYVPLTPGGLR